MPSVPRLTDSDLDEIAAFLRNGTLPARYKSRRTATSFLSKAARCSLVGGTVYLDGLPTLRSGEKQAAIMKLYRHPVDGHVGAGRLWPKLRKLYGNVLRKDVETALGKVEDRQINREVPKKTVVRPIVSRTPMAHLQADLVEMKTAPGGAKFLLTTIDTHSRYAFARKLTTKSGPAVAKQMGSILDEVKRLGFTPKVVQSDNGSEFIAGEFQAMLKERGIRHVRSLSYTPQSQGMIERWHGTLKRTIANRGEPWWLVLDEVIAGYNTTRHSSIKKTPTEALKLDEAVRQDTVKNIERKAQKSIVREKRRFPPIRRGQWVRIAVTSLDSKQRALALSGFRKSTLGSWTRAVFEVTGISKPNSTLTTAVTYSLSEVVGDKRAGRISGRFRRDELLAIDKTIIKRQKKAVKERQSKPAPEVEPAAATRTKRVRKQVDRGAMVTEY